jgi:dihydroorotase
LLGGGAGRLDILSRVDTQRHSGLPTRRQLLRTTAALPAILAGSTELRAAKYDLVIRGGHVIDPSQGLDLTVHVAIHNGKIAAISPRIAPGDARETFDAIGKLVMPGLIDIHSHLGDPGMPPATCLQDGVTTLVDAGSAGSQNIDDLVKVVQAAPNRARVLINIAPRGVEPMGELMDLSRVDVEGTRRAIERHRQWIIGVKARLSRNVAGDHDLEALRLARQVADAAKVPIMVHVGDTAAPLTEIVALLRPGDIVTHMYAPAPHGMLDDDGKVLFKIREARRRGVLFDFGNGRTLHFDWATAQKGIEQDFLPDTISTDMTLLGRTAQVFSLPNVMSKLLMLGMKMNQVVACVTSSAAHAFPEFKSYGTLRPGSAADVTVLDLQQGDFEFVDNYGGTRRAPRRLAPNTVFVAGKRM